jgi:hypothetical protein
MPKFQVREGFSERFSQWLSDCQTIIDNYHEDAFPFLPRGVLYHTGGTRYARVEYHQENSTGGVSRRAWGFVDVTNGDILKPESFKKPAKHARGNIFDDSRGLSKVGPYGPAYLDSKPLGMKPEYLPLREQNS